MYMCYVLEVIVLVLGVMDEVIKDEIDVSYYVVFYYLKDFIIYLEVIKNVLCKVIYLYLLFYL